MKKYVAEMIGTMVLVLMGCGSAVIAGAEIGFFGDCFRFWFVCGSNGICYWWYFRMSY